MRLKDKFEIVNLGDECLIVPVAEAANTFNGVVTVNAEAALLIENMSDDVELSDLIQILTQEYDVDYEHAKEDIIKFLEKINQMGLID